MARSKSSRRWLNEHFTDQWVAKAQAEGYRSRASYKLIEIAEKDRILKKGMRVLDLGSAPGGWSQVATKFLQGSGQVVASDILEMDAIEEVTFIQGDFREDDVFENILAALDNQPVDLVMSDMAPNMSGNRAVDQPRSMYLAELALDMALHVLAPNGHFLVKVFQGEGIEEYRSLMRKNFKRFVTRKPAASRARSPEVYLLGSGLKQ